MATILLLRTCEAFWPFWNKNKIIGDFFPKFHLIFDCSVMSGRFHVWQYIAINNVPERQLMTKISRYFLTNHYVEYVKWLEDKSAKKPYEIESNDWAIILSSSSSRGFYFPHHWFIKLSTTTVAAVHKKASTNWIRSTHFQMVHVNQFRY